MVSFVRGPKTARVLRLRYEKVVTDPAIMVADCLKRREPEHRDIEVAFMPRWRVALADKSLRKRMRDVGVTLIDPTDPVEEVLARMCRAKLLVTEALHGAVVADALRIPWIPVLGERGHLFKWLDWTASMGLQYDPVDLEVSSITDAVEYGERMLSAHGLSLARRARIREKIEDVRGWLCSNSS
jgi:succinoglycan biosynthesis protein ExoV